MSNFFRETSFFYFFLFFFFLFFSDLYKSPKVSRDHISVMSWDLNVEWTTPQSGREIAEAAQKLGYVGIVFNHTTDKLNQKDTCTIKPLPLTITDLVTPQIGLLRNRSLSSKPDFQQRTRITINMSDVSQHHGLSASNATLASYDLIAVNPSNDKVLHAVLQNEIVDLISFDLSQRLPFFLKLTPVNMAISRGVFFEIAYSASLNDTTARRNFISNLQHILHLTRGRQVCNAHSNLFQRIYPENVLN